MYDLFEYYRLFLPLTGPWAVLTILLGIAIGKRNGRTLLHLNDVDSWSLAVRANLISFALCMPFALMMPMWTFFYVGVYVALAAGVQYQVARFSTLNARSNLTSDGQSLIPTDKDYWNYAFSFMTGTFGWSLLIAIACFTIDKFSP